MIRLVTALFTLMFIFYVAFTFKKAIDKVLGYTAVLLPIVGLLFITATLPDILDRTASVATWMVFILAWMGILTGIRLLVDARQSTRKSVNQQSEKGLLQIVRRYEGRVTPIEIALETDLTVAEAEEKLNTFCEQNVAEREITPTGKVVYVFPGFMSEAEKKQAEDPMTL